MQARYIVVEAGAVQVLCLVDDSSIEIKDPEAEDIGIARVEMDLVFRWVRIQVDLGRQRVSVTRRGFADMDIVYHEYELVF